MDRYKENAKWLTYFAPFRALSISAAYLTPFCKKNGVTLSQIFLLQSIFSVAFLLWELPSGYIADRLGRAFSIKLSVPFAAAAMVAYGLSHQFWQFALWEIVLALANGLISGIDTALLLDSLKADGEEKQYVKLSQRINAFGFAATALGVPIALLLVRYVSISSTLIADGLLTAFGGLFALKLSEAPRFNGDQEAISLSAWRAMKQFLNNAEVRWLLTLMATLSTATYLAFWLTAPYYTKIGIPVVWFGAILAARSICKAWLSHRFTQERYVERNLIAYATLAGIAYLAMASGQPWLAWLVLGHDVVQALQSQPLSAKLNEHITHEYRATMNSLANLVQRLLYSITGPLLGLLVDHTSMGVGFVATGLATCATAMIALARLHTLQTFREEN